MTARHESNAGPPPFGTALRVICGFLGSGKTTLLQKLLARRIGRRVAVVVNEMGALGVDAAVVDRFGVDVTEINNGSVFCPCRSASFVSTLVALAPRGFDEVVVEASGLANPLDMPKILDVVAHNTQGAFCLQGCVCVVDAARLVPLLSANVLVEQQIAAAQLVLVNKADLVDASTLTEVTSRVRAINPRAHVITTSFSTLSETDWRRLDETAPAEPAPVAHRRDLSTRKRLVRFEQCLNREQLLEGLRCIGSASYRVKGFVRLHEGWCRVDCVGAQIKIYPESAPVGSEGSALVVLAGGEQGVDDALRASGWTAAGDRPQGKEA